MLNPTMTIEEDPKSLAKLMFISNALNKGWAVRKRGDKYVFRKKHNGDVSVFSKTFVEDFVRENTQ